eukprot:SM000261S09965  [mRNA]  locus=s261:2359:6336:+ [translate_table: standard]
MLQASAVSALSCLFTSTCCSSPSFRPKGSGTLDTTRLPCISKQRGQQTGDACTSIAHDAITGTSNDKKSATSVTLQASAGATSCIVKAELPDGSLHEFPSVQHQEDFWTVWRHLMPLHTESTSVINAGVEREMMYPLTRLQARVADCASVNLRQQNINQLISSLEARLLRTKLDAIAAPQLGLPYKAVALNLVESRVATQGKQGTQAEQIQLFINPYIIWQSRAPKHAKESCASLAGLSLGIAVSDSVLPWSFVMLIKQRPECLLVAAQNGRGRWFLSLLRGREARALGRAFDYIAGILPLDRVKEKTRRAVRHELRAQEAAACNMCQKHSLVAQKSEAAVWAASVQWRSHNCGPRMDHPACFAAYHEAGHAVMGCLLPLTRVEGVSLTRRGWRDYTGGTEIVWQAVELKFEDRIRQAMAVWLGGLAAEELMFGRADQYGSREGCITFSDDLVNVAALATAFAAACRIEQARACGAGEVDGAVRKLATAPESTGWTQPLFTWSRMAQPTAAASSQSSNCWVRNASAPVAALVDDDDAAVNIPDWAAHMPGGSVHLGKIVADTSVKPLPGDRREAGSLSPPTNSCWRRPLSLRCTGPHESRMLELVDSAYQVANQILVAHESALHKIAGLLMDRGRASTSEIYGNLKSPNSS